MLDCTYRVQVPHRTGQLARVMGAIGEGEGLIGDVVTISTGRETSIREITVEVRDVEQAERIAGRLERVDGVRVLWYQIRAGAKEIDVEMKLAAAKAIAEMAEGDELVPDVLDQGVHDTVAQAVQEAAERSGTARPELAATGL